MGGRTVFVGRGETMVWESFPHSEVQCDGARGFPDGKLFAGFHSCQKKTYNDSPRWQETTADFYLEVWRTNTPIVR